MTPSELESYLTPIVTNTQYTTEQRASLLADVAVLWISEHPLHDPQDPDSLHQIFNEWNLVMCTIVDKHQLRRH
jgi:hypothetical protein